MKNKSLKKMLSIIILITIGIMLLLQNKIYAIEIQSEIKVATIEELLSCSTWQEVYEKYGADRFGKCENMEESNDENENLLNFNNRATELTHMTNILYYNIQNGWNLKIQKMDESELSAYIQCIEKCMNNPAWSQLDKDYTKASVHKTTMLKATTDLNIARTNISDALDELKTYYDENVLSKEDLDKMNAIQNQIDKDVSQSVNTQISESNAEQNKKDKDWSISGTVIMGNDKKTEGGSATDIRDDLDDYKPSGNIQEREKLQEIGAVIISALRIVGVVVAVITLSVLGFKYMAGGTAEKAEYKKTMIPFLIGAGMLLIGTQLVGILYDIISKNIK